MFFRWFHTGKPISMRGFCILRGVTESGLWSNGLNPAQAGSPLCYDWHNRQNGQPTRPTFIKSIWNQAVKKVVELLKGVPNIISLIRPLFHFYNLFHAWEEEAVNNLKAKLSILEVHAIEALGRRPGLKMRDLAEILEISTPSVTSVIDKLEKKGFAHRKTTPADRRVFLIELTKKGMALFEKHSEQHRVIAERVLSCISEDNVTLFVDTLRKIVNKSSEPTSPQ